MDHELSSYTDQGWNCVLSVYLLCVCRSFTGLPWWLSSKESACSAGDTGLIPGVGRSSAGEGMATHSSILDWRILWTEEPGGLQSMGSQRTEAAEHACTQAINTTLLSCCFPYLEKLG